MKTRDPDDIRRAAGRKGRYRLLRPVGANRFASLWRGEDSETGDAVLVEVIRSAPPPDPQDAKILRDRMAATQDLPLHPGLLAVRSIHAPEPPGKLAVASRAAVRARARRGVEELQWLLVLDPFDGSTLDHRAAFRDLSPAAVCAIAAKVGEALAALHAVGVAHGSVSPTSVLVSDEGEVRLIDAIVGSWLHARATGGDGGDRREDVAALARLVTDLLSPVAVPLELRSMLAAPGSLDELIERLREAGAPATRTGEVTAIAEPAVEPEPESDERAEELERQRTLEEERRRERERVEAARRRAEERARAQAEARAEAERRRAAEQEARRREQELRKAAEAEELRRQLAQRSEPEPEPLAEPEPEAVVVVPDLPEGDRSNGHAPRSAPEQPDAPARRVAAARAVAVTADRPAATTSTPSRPVSEPVISLPQPPAVAPSSELDRTTGTPATSIDPPARPALPTSEPNWSAEREMEPALWMKMVGVLASIAMFAAVAAAVYYLLINP
jgi:hypothetical protein